MSDANTIISQARLLLGDKKKLLKFAKDLPKPVDLVVLEYLESYLGAWTIEGQEKLFAKRHPGRGIVYHQRPQEQFDLRERHPKRVDFLLGFANQERGNLTPGSRKAFNKRVRTRMKETGKTCFRVLEDLDLEDRKAKAAAFRRKMEKMQKKEPPKRKEPSPPRPKGVKFNSQSLDDVLSEVLGDD